jgi:predicted PurR-regulated permease PerM
VLGVTVLAAKILPHVLIIVVPLVAALLFTALLSPLSSLLNRTGVPRLLATFLVVFGSLGILITIILLIAPSVSSEFGTLRASLDSGLARIEEWLVNGPLGLSQSTVSGWDADLRSQTGTITTSLARSAVAQTPLVLDVLGGSILTLVLTFFFIKDGASGVDQATRRWDPSSRARLDNVWVALTGYSQGVVVNGFVNASVLGLALVILGIPLALPIAVITFVASFIPVAGAIVAGAMAALVALVAAGPVSAAIVIGVTVAIHNLEGYVVGPLVIGRRVGLHPVLLILAFLIGTIVAGIPGGFLAGPVAAAVSGWSGPQAVSQPAGPGVESSVEPSPDPESEEVGK